MLQLHPTKITGALVSIRSIAVLLLSLTLSCATTEKTATKAAQAAAQRFPTSEAAVTALESAVEKGDVEQLRRLFGAEGSELVSSGDTVADTAALERFAEAVKENVTVEQESENRLQLLLGAKAWPFPVPLVKEENNAWFFDSEAGKEEILDRRIGENELRTIRFLRSYVQAQKEYSAVDRDKDGIREFATRALSSPGAKDGLYWDQQAHDSVSPFGPLAAQAVLEGYRRQEGQTPFHGYYFRFLTAQGVDADGGAKDYLDSAGNMVHGFALLGYPARWGSSGVMSFIVNQDGVVYESDLGVRTLSEAEQITQFNPDAQWQPTVESLIDAVELQD